MASRGPNSSHELSKPANTGVVTHPPAPLRTEAPGWADLPQGRLETFLSGGESWGAVLLALRRPLGHMSPERRAPSGRLTALGVWGTAETPGCGCEVLSCEAPAPLPPGSRLPGRGTNPWCAAAAAAPFAPHPPHAQPGAVRARLALWWLPPESAQLRGIPHPPALPLPTFLWHFPPEPGPEDLGRPQAPAAVSSATASPPGWCPSPPPSLPHCLLPLLWPRVPGTLPGTPQPCCCGPCCQGHPGSLGPVPCKDPRHPEPHPQSDFFSLSQCALYHMPP